MLTYLIDAITDPPGMALGRPTPFVRASFVIDAECEGYARRKGCQYRVRLRRTLRDLRRLVGRETRVTHLGIIGPVQV